MSMWHTANAAADRTIKEAVVSPPGRLSMYGGRTFYHIASGKYRPSMGDNGYHVYHEPRRGKYHAVIDTTDPHGYHLHDIGHGHPNHNYLGEHDTLGAAVTAGLNWVNEAEGLADHYRRQRQQEQ